MHFLKTSTGQPSGPGTLPNVNFSNTTDGLIVIVDREMSSFYLDESWGTVFGSSVVKTLEKNLLSALDLSLSEV